MPLYEEKFICPLAIRFSQARIRPTFQDGRVVERTLQQIEAIPWPLEDNAYDLLLHVPFPPIEIIRWRPKLREEDGRTLVDEDGATMMGETCWFTFDNRRLYCLQAAAAKQWPRQSAAVVHIMHDLPLSRCTPRKFRTTDLGCSVRIARRHDPMPRAIWNWDEATRSGGNHTGPQSDASCAAQEKVLADASKDDWAELIDVPADLLHKGPCGFMKTTVATAQPSVVSGPEGRHTQSEASATKCQSRAEASSSRSQTRPETPVAKEPQNFMTKDRTKSFEEHDAASSRKSYAEPLGGPPATSLARVPVTSAFDSPPATSLARTPATSAYDGKQMPTTSAFDGKHMPTTTAMAPGLLLPTTSALPLAAASKLPMPTSSADSDSDDACVQQ